MTTPYRQREAFTREYYALQGFYLRDFSSIAFIMLNGGRTSCCVEHNILQLYEQPLPKACGYRFFMRLERPMIRGKFYIFSHKDLRERTPSEYTCKYFTYLYRISIELLNYVKKAPLYFMLVIRRFCLHSLKFYRNIAYNIPVALHSFIFVQSRYLRHIILYVIIVNFNDILSNNYKV